MHPRGGVNIGILVESKTVNLRQCECGGILNESIYLNPAGPCKNHETTQGLGYLCISLSYLVSHQVSGFCVIQC